MSQAPSRAVKLFGTEEPPAETRLLRAGPLSAELDAGNLRFIRYGGREVLHAISYVVRDQYWGTYNPAISGLTVEEDEGVFTVRYDALCRDGGQACRYSATITGSADGTLRFAATGTPETDFLTNRTGFVILHGVEGISGRPARVLHVDGRTVETTFPEVIDPKQPIMDIRALTHEAAPGLRVTCTLQGDTFEMEDQRNWTDASYKTYVRPLGLPFPYTLPAGESFEQSVELEIDGSVPAAMAGGGEAITVTLGEAEGRVPRFAMGLEPQHAEAALARREVLSSLAPAFLSCFHDGRQAGPEAMRGFAAVAEMLGADPALEAVVPGEGDPAAELAPIAAQAGQAGLHLASIAVSPARDMDFIQPGTVFPDARDFERLYAAARATFPGVPLGGGSFAYFTELNRRPPPVALLDFVCHTTCAIVHAADDRSVAETIECLPYVIASGRAMAGDKEYRVGPGSLGSRTSPFGGPTAPNPHNGRVTMTRNDPRQRSLLGAAWHLGYAARMAEGGVDTVILGAPVGEYGLVHHPMDYPQPWYDEAGGLYPVYHLMRAIYAASGAPRRATAVSAPSRLQALAYEQDGGLALWLANLTGEVQRVALEGFGSGTARACRLDEETFEACARDVDGFDAGAAEITADRLELAPYAVVCLSSTSA